MTLDLEKMTKQLISKHQISSDELSRKRSLQERGITLIALVVTIIILLILAGVTLNIALSDGGLFSKTQEAAEKYKQAQSDEEEMVRQIATQMYSEYIGVEVTGYTPTGTTCTIDSNVSGYNSSQTFDLDSNMTWRVWDFDGNILRIIGEPTEQLTLNGATGYNNGTWVMDYICKELYSNNKDGVSVTTLKRSDIQKVSNYDYTKFRREINKMTEVEENTEGTIMFGQSKEITCKEGWLPYPIMWEKNDKDWKYEYNADGSITGSDKECNTWESIENYAGTENTTIDWSNKTVSFKNSYYGHIYRENDFTNSIYLSLLENIIKTDNEKKILLGTRDLYTNDYGVFFGFNVLNINDNGKLELNTNSVLGGNREIDTISAVVPIATIDLQKSSCELIKKEENGKTKIELKFN